MRVVAGEFKGRTIDAPSGRNTRPTTDRVRESIFSSIYSRRSDLGDTSVLDAFAGSGALGIEALSRGASACTFFEQDGNARRVLEKNLSCLGLGAPAVKVIAADVFDAAVSAVGADRFGLVLLDPPYVYDPDRVHALLVDLCEHDLLESPCTIVYEHSLDRSEEVIDAFSEDGRFAITGRKKYGKIGVTYLAFGEQGD